jgi:chemotaxis protein MotA
MEKWVVMDIATLIGLIGGAGIIIAAIVVDSTLSTFINVPSILLVVGGTIAVAMIKFPLKDLLGSLTVARNAFRESDEDPAELIEKSVELSRIVRKEGLLALENQDVQSEFFRKGLRLCADGLEPEVVRKVLTTEMVRSVERHKSGQQIFRAIGETAPAMGMIGTLIGLVQMLTLMDDPSEIGPAMAVALLTTLYGALISNMVALPIAEKLSVKARKERLTKALVIEGINAIQQSHNPRVVQELLRTYLPKGMRETSGGGQAGAKAGAPATEAA